MQHHRINPAALKKTLLSSSTYSTSFFRCTDVSNDCGGGRYTSVHNSGNSCASGVDVLASCSARKQVRVSLDSVLDVSMGKRPWRSSFSEDNPELRQHAGAPKAMPHQQQRQQAKTISLPEVAATSFEQQRHETELPAGGEGLLQSAQYLHRELPVRLASAVLELDKMKDTGLVNTPSVQRVREDYLLNFRELQAAEKPSDAKTVAAFTATVKRAQARGCDTVLLVARGLQELMGGGSKRSSSTEHSQEGAEGGVGWSGREAGEGWSAAQRQAELSTICPHLGRVQDFLDNFYQAHGGGASAAATAAAAANDGFEEDEQRFGEEGRRRPSVDGVSQMDRPEDGGNDEQEFSGGGGDGASGWGSDAHVVFANVPEVTIYVRTDGEDDVLLVVSDRGGGIAEENMNKVWSYLYTTAGEAVRNTYLENGGNSRSKPSPLAGLGYGLPLSRLYARCFGGELTLRSELGEGTDAIVRISRRGTRLEPLVWPRACDAS